MEDLILNREVLVVWWENDMEKDEKEPSVAIAVDERGDTIVALECRDRIRQKKKCQRWKPEPAHHQLSLAY